MDYLPEEAFGLRIYATNEQFANTVKNGLRGVFFLFSGDI